MTKIHIHEDDEGMRSLYPADAQSEVEQDIIAAEEASLRNRAPNGIGWTDIHQIKEPKCTYPEVGTSLEAMATAVDQHLPRVSHFEVGFGEGNPFHYRDIDGYTFGFGRHLYIRFDTKEDALHGIWYDVATSNESELTALRNAFLEIDKVQSSMVADYWMSAGGLIEDKAFLDGYFSEVERRSAELAAVETLKPKPTFLERLTNRLLGR